MIRFSALNDADKVSDDIESGLQPKLPSQQAQEAEILQQYNEALSEQRKKNIDGAIQIFHELLASSFLAKADPVENSQETSPNGLSPIYGRTDLNIKYSCFKNLAQIYKSRKQLSTSLDYYVKALELDGTDVMMWYQAGIVSSKLGLIHFAPHAFLRGVACSNQNWLCLDRAAISLYILGDVALVMEVLAHCFKLNPSYPRGLLLRDLILETHPWVRKDIETIYPGINLQFDKMYKGPDNEKTKLLKEIETLRENFYLQKKKIAEKPVLNVELVEPLVSLTWEAVGESILLLRKWFVDENEDTSQRRINLLTKMPARLESCESEAKNDPGEPMEVVVDEGAVAADKVEDKAEQDQEVVEDKRGRKRRSGSALMEELFWSGKRRSTRQRTNRKEQESMSVADALSNILPRNLMTRNKPSQTERKEINDDSMDTMDLYRLFEKQAEADVPTGSGVSLVEKDGDRDKTVEKEGYFGTLQEESDVQAFLESHDKQSFVEIIQSFVLALEKLWSKTWPKKLVNIFIENYKAMRCYFPIQLQFLSCDELRVTAYQESGASLLYHELLVDILESNCDKSLPLSEMQPIMELVNYPSVFKDCLEYGIFELRLMWMRANLFLGRGQSSEAISYLYSTLNCYTEHPCLEGKVIQLPNCTNNREISKDIAQAALDAQSRKKSLAEVLRLYHEKSYKEVTEILKDYFSTNGLKEAKRDQEKELVDRSTQLSIYINSLYQLDEYMQCVNWLETSCYELMGKVLVCQNYDESDEKSQEWKIEFDRILVALEECCDLGNFEITDALTPARLSRFLQTLCRAICKQLEDYERPPCASRPWIMLNRILISHEKAEDAKGGSPTKEKKVINDEDEDEDEPDIPPSVLLLFTAHEYLGRREWCNCDGNVLLYRILDQAIPRIRSPEWSTFRDTVQQYLDQAVFCLYAHPSKKNKAKCIIDHNVTPVPMTWEHAMQLFQLYRPDEIPCFDSIRSNISSDCEILFRRIAALIPEDIDPAKGSQTLTDYIYGKTTEPPKSIVKLPPQVQDLFYIIGDHYFRTHESTKAVSYLTIDLCANVDRVDSWASMALSKGTMLEHRLIHCEPINNDEFLEEALATVRCFEHCLKLDSTICTLWIEYGTFCYTIHAFCSQRMKLESDSLSLEQFEEIENTKTRMLESAKEAFINANNIWSRSVDEERHDERWLHHYMLGKICEKYGDLSYIDHYGKAAQLLYDNNAHYPKKISYNVPQALAIEAMEIYYRAHVCVIKYLELHDGELSDAKMRDAFLKFIDSFADSPFAKHFSKADLAKQKIKEAEERELAIQREKDVLIGIINDLINRIEGNEKDELVRLKEKNEIIENILNGLVDDAVKQPQSQCNGGERIDNGVPSNEVEEVEMKSLKNELSQSDTDHLLDEEIDLLQLAKDAEMENEKCAATEPMETDNSEIHYDAAMFCPQGRNLPPNMPIDASYLESATFEAYPHEQLLEDNYYLTLDDYLTKSTPPTQSSRKRPHASAASSVSSDSEEIAYADESSSSSDSSSSSESDSESDEPKPRKKGSKAATPAKTSENQVDEKKDDVDIVSPKPDKSVPPEVALLQQCLSAFEVCAVRFPQHYKSVYRLAHFYYRSKKNRNLEKCKDLLLGQYKTPFGNISGLFSDRKNTNFFNGIWRLPASDVDRPGSFASHMSRSVLLLLEVLRDLRDAKLLLELSLQLRKVPEPDKRYLREDERTQLSVQSMTLCLQTLRHTVKHTEVMTLPIVLDTYRMFRKVQKHYPAKANMFRDNLLEAFNRLGSRGARCSLEQCLKFCQGELTGNRIAFPTQFTPAKSNNVPKVRKIRNAKESKPANKEDQAKLNSTEKVDNPPTIEVAVVPTPHSSEKAANDVEPLKSLDDKVSSDVNAVEVVSKGNVKDKEGEIANATKPISGPLKDTGRVPLPKVALDLCKVSSFSENADQKMLTVPQLPSSLSVSLVKEGNESKSSSSTLPSFLSLPKETNISITPVPSKESLADSKSNNVSPSVIAYNHQSRANSRPPMPTSSDLKEKPCSVITSTSSVEIKKVTPYVKTDSAKKPESSLKRTALKESKALPVAAVGSKSGMMDMPPSLPGFLPKGPSFLNATAAPAATPAFPMIPQPQLFGFPVNYSNESFVNQYSSIMADFFAMAQSQNTASSKHRNPLFSKLLSETSQTSSKAPTSPLTSQSKPAVGNSKQVPSPLQIKRPLSSQKPPNQQAHKSVSNPMEQFQKLLTSRSVVPPPNPGTALAHHKNLPMASNVSSSKPNVPVLQLSPRKQVIEQRGKFNIADILSGNSSITVTHTKVPPITSSDDRGQSEAINLCSKTSKHPAAEPQNKKGGPPSPEVVTIDD